MKESETEQQAGISCNVILRPDGVLLEGELRIPVGAEGIVLFAHGSGSSCQSPRNQFVAQIIRDLGIGTLLFGLLTREEEAVDMQTRHLRFDIGLLARRLAGVTRWIKDQSEAKSLRIGYFSVSIGGGAALVAAAKLGAEIGAVVSRSGRPDLAGDALARVVAPTLLIVGGSDDVVIRLNQEALATLQCVKELKIVPGATHLFEEPGKLGEVAHISADWFRKHLRADPLALSL